MGRVVVATGSAFQLLHCNDTVRREVCVLRPTFTISFDLEALASPRVRYVLQLSLCFWNMA